MGLGPEYRRTTIRDHLKKPTTHLEEWLAKVVEAPDWKTETTTLWASYAEFVCSKEGYTVACKVLEIIQLGKLTREEDIEAAPEQVRVLCEGTFRNDFSAVAPLLNFKPDTDGVRGYRVKLLGTSRNLTPVAINPRRSIRIRETTHATPRQYGPVNIFKILYIGPNIGKGGVANIRILKGTLIVEYKGQPVSEDEAKRRDKIYKDRGMVPTLVDLGPLRRNLVLDAYMDRDGATELTKETNPAAYFNHTLEDPNCVLVAEKRGGVEKYFIKARKTISAGTSILWDYADRKSDCDFLKK